MFEHILEPWTNESKSAPWFVRGYYAWF